MKYLLEIGYPYSWRQGYVLHFSTLEEARAHATNIPSGPDGTETYARIVIWELVEDVN